MIPFNRMFSLIILLSISWVALAQPPIEISDGKIKTPPPVIPKDEPKTPPRFKPTPDPSPKPTPKPGQILPQGVKEITIFAFDDYSKIKFQYTGSKEIEDLGDTAIVGMQLQPNTKYILQVKVEKYIHPIYNIDAERYVLYKQILPVPVIPDNIPNNPIFNGKELYVYELPNGKVIQTNNTILFTGQWIEPNGSISIKKYGENDFKYFSGYIYGFTFHEGATYILEVKKVGSDFILINVLSETPTNVSKPATKQYPAIPPHIINRILTEEAVKDSKITAEPVYEVEEITNAKATNYYPVFNATSLDSAIWHLRYLYEADGITPHNFTEEDNDLYFSVTFDKFFNKAKGNAPCSPFEAKLLTNESDKFDCYNLIASDRRCDASTLQQVFFKQLQTVNKYDIVDNKLRLLKDSKVLLLFEGFAIK
ncbi:MAG: hypothetical protein U0T69_10820 [Chitinophagales bacterium]